jgi:phosphoglycerate dehydrogenase-like enzyme
VTSTAATISLYSTQITGGVVAGLSQLQWIGLLSVGIFVFQIAFGVLLVIVVANLPDR